MTGRDKDAIVWLAEAQRLGKETTALVEQLQALTPQTGTFPILDLTKQIEATCVMSKWQEMATALNRQFAPVLEVEKRYRDAMLALPNWAFELPQIDWDWKVMDWPTVDPLWAKWQAPETAAFCTINDKMLAWTNAFQGVQAAFEDPDLTVAKCKRIEEAGWLPHYTAPSEKVDELGDDIEALDAALAGHYAQHWPEVEAAFLEHLDGYAVDDQAKGAFRQALHLHAQGAHTFCIRGLFPEIERIARLELHGGALLQIASLHGLRKAAGELGPWETDPGGWPGMRLYSKLAHHLYARVTTPEELAAVAQDPVPNRHAALHGLVSYSEAKNSINLLIMADFIFQVFTALKAEVDDAEQAA